MGQKSIVKEIKKRFPHIVINLTMALLFWIISQIGPVFLKDITIPGVSIEPLNNAGFIFRATATLIAVIFVIGAVPDISVFIDIISKVIFKRLGIKEEKPLKRMGRDFVYIILALLLAAAISPFVDSMPQIGEYLAVIISLGLLAIFLILVYDIGRILYVVIQEKAQKVADRIASIAEEKTQENSQKEGQQK